MSIAKATLTEKLADLLGFEDGAQDVLDHLLSIESSEVRWHLLNCSFSSEDKFSSCELNMNCL